MTATIHATAGNTISTGADSTLSVTFGKTSGTGSVTGLGSSTAVAGVATLTVAGNVAGSVTITASATGSGGALAAGTGNPIAFNVVVGIASKLAFVQQPTTTTAGQTISPAVTVQIQDANGNLTTSTASVGIAILFNPSSGTLNGGTPVSAVGGTATFSNLSIDKAGVNYTLQAASTGLTSATSAQITINNPAPTLASIAPASGNLSDTFDVVFNGTNYISGVSSVSFGPNITVNTVTVNSSIKITANITIGSGAAVGARNVSVTNPAPGGGTASLTNAFTVNNPATTTTLDSSVNPSTYGDSVTFTATVTSVSGTPTGSVTFYDSATCSGTVLAGPTTLDVNGKAGFTTSSLTVPSHTITACYSPTGIYLASNGSVTQTVNKRPATWTTDANSKTYGVADPVPLTTGSGTGFLFSDSVTASYSRDLAETVAGGPYHITATLSPAAVLSNYNITNAGADFTIAKADATIIVTPYDVPYDGDPHTASGTAKGVKGESLSGLDLSHTTHTSAGTYSTDYWSFTDSTGNYNNVGNTTITDHIAKANATVVVTPYNVPYNGHSHTATITSITGVNSETGATVVTVNVIKTTHTPAGTYASNYWKSTGTANYDNIGNTTITDTINKADATVVVTPYTSLTTTYNGNPHTATITSITGVNGETGATVGTVNVSNTIHTNAGTYASDYWFFTGMANYNNIGNTTITDSIGKANAVVVVTPYTSLTTTYDGNLHTATVTSITGVNSETGVTVGTVDVSHTIHTNAGTYASDYWFFTGMANYNDIGHTPITDSIGKATATIVVTPYTSLTTTYDGQPPPPAALSISGVNGETGATVGTVDVSHTTHTDAGTYASDYWFFTGAANYNDIGDTTITD